MRRSPSLVLALVLVLIVVLGTALVQSQKPPRPTVDDPWSRMPSRAAHFDHSTFFAEVAGELETGPDVTRACLRCHEDEAHEVMQTSHWSWTGDHVERDGETVAIGKKNLLNNFCISIESNWPACTTCHAGYGWRDADFDFSDPTRVDCLVCHDTSGQYRKKGGGAGLPADDVDLLAAARSVGVPTRDNCGRCHFNGGGGNAVKHGDLDGSMYYPHENVDVHMGRHDFLCQDCHQTRDHELPGRSMSVSVSNTNRVRCTDCHDDTPHGHDRLDAHTTTVACQTCHIPYMAVRTPTKMQWDWSKAGEDRPDADPHEYLKIKGEFLYDENVAPEYAWYDGHSTRYLKGDRIDPTSVTPMNEPLGDIDDPDARIWPFKIHRGMQLYDTEHLYMLNPKTYGEGGYWKDFDWDQAARLGADASGLDYSGGYGFAPTRMSWPLSHMVAPVEDALQCIDCHGPGGRMDWQALGYGVDPATGGGRFLVPTALTRTEGGAR